MFDFCRKWYCKPIWSKFLLLTDNQWKLAKILKFENPMFSRLPESLWKVFKIDLQEFKLDFRTIKTVFCILRQSTFITTIYRKYKCLRQRSNWWMISSTTRPITKLLIYACKNKVVHIILYWLNQIYTI